ncbi:apoptosis-associated speck-like protein containing a CARD isoform X1 [Pseudonaja textilis]|uniref:apoptosis-associated speck-like protein containing a CARD isoform X1 n=1 Tax=Pseudonaja textilis TaxID=8673 RepID=UPI000EA88A2B|nr:apoptosis-associated speck-like protein containing a CARD isoform X1 [Pseudonaja textilis]
MAKSVRCCLSEALENLTDPELEKFKAKLNEFPVKEGFSNIPRGPLQKAGALQLSDLLVSYYCQDYAVEVAAKVLSDSNCKPQAQKLLRDTGKDASNSVQEPVPQLSTHSRQAGNQPSSSSHRHFIDQFREQLIQRTATVEQVLDKLLHKSIVNEEQYQKICSQETNQDKMRKLYKLVPSWNDQCKDQLKNALKDVNPCLIKDLEGE